LCDALLGCRSCGNAIYVASFGSSLIADGRVAGPIADARVALAADAFIYGFPLVFDVQEADRFARGGIGAVPATPLNQFGHASALAGPETKFVSVNNDTVYSIANVDTSGGPVRLDVPDTSGRYYVLQFVDAWTNNFAYVGHIARPEPPSDRFCWCRPGGTARHPMT
jgi:hypothetical protein